MKNRACKEKYGITQAYILIKLKIENGTSSCSTIFDQISGLLCNSYKITASR
jgi:hypothetical protein